jgi:hypothetical protein
LWLWKWLCWWEDGEKVVLVRARLVGGLLMSSPEM